MRSGKVLRLEQGLAEIEFDRGTRVILHGPSGVQLVSATTARLLYGTLTAGARAGPRLHRAFAQRQGRRPGNRIWPFRRRGRRHERAGIHRPGRGLPARLVRQGPARSHDSPRSDRPDRRSHRRRRSAGFRKRHRRLRPRDSTPADSHASHLEPRLHPACPPQLARRLRPRHRLHPPASGHRVAIPDATPTCSCAGAPPWSSPPPAAI